MNGLNNIWPSYGVRNFSPAFNGPIYWPASRLFGRSGSGMNPAVKSGTEVPHSIKDRNRMLNP